MKLSVVIPVHDEEASVAACLDGLTGTLRRHRIPYEIVLVDDDSADDTGRVALARAAEDPAIRCIRRPPPAGFGRAIRAGRVWTNCYHLYPAHAAFGGYKQSGVGRENHKMMLEHYQQTKNQLVSYSPSALGFF